MDFALLAKLLKTPDINVLTMYWAGTRPSVYDMMAGQGKVIAI